MNKHFVILLLNQLVQLISSLRYLFSKYLFIIVIYWKLNDLLDFTLSIKIEHSFLVYLSALWLIKCLNVEYSCYTHLSKFKNIWLRLRIRADHKLRLNYFNEIKFRDKISITFVDHPIYHEYFVSILMTVFL